MSSFPNTRWSVYPGIAATPTLYKNHRELFIFCPELLPYKKGDISSNAAVQRVSVKNEADGSTVAFDAEITSTIKADYFGFSSGHSVPTIVKGMQVLVLNYGNSDKYYWVPLERDDHLKNFEHIRLSCKNANKIADGATSDMEPDDIAAKQASITDDNTYFLEIDTKYNKHILISTSNSDGEAWRYGIKIDANEHTMELWDQCSDGSQLNNFIKLESRPGMDPNVKGRITMQTAGQATIMLDGEDITIQAPRHLYLSVGGDVIRHTKGNEAHTVDKDSLTKIGGNNTKVVDKTLSLTVKEDAVYNYQANKSVVVAKEHFENQETRTTSSKNATWITETWGLNALTSVTVTALKTTMSLGVAKCVATQLIINNGAVMLIGNAFTFNASAMVVAANVLTVNFKGGVITGGGQVLYPS